MTVHYTLKADTVAELLSAIRNTTGASYSHLSYVIGCEYNRLTLIKSGKRPLTAWIAEDLDRYLITRHNTKTNIKELVNEKHKTTHNT